MTVKKLKNAAMSIRQKLLNKANAENRTFNEILQYYCMERFLYRLSVSSHADKFILKGALMLRVWQAPEIRPTMDIDAPATIWRILPESSEQYVNLISLMTTA